ncbi:MAG: hypothetical protein GF399_05110 [Candidatus Coatesbacteria bacterium]|nr:hypothetical protein [Candidatus Coatesbacteria bacterium]
MDKYYEWRAMIIEYLNSEPSAMGGQAEGFQMNDGHVGLITASNGSNTASGVPYNSDKLYAAINLASSISHYKLMTEFLVIRTEYASDWDNTQLIGPSITVIAIDYFEDYNNPDRLLLLSPTAAEEIGLNPIKGIMQVSVDSTNSE